VSRSKEAVYRQSGEAEYDEAGSPSKPETGRAEDQADDEPDAVVTLLTTHREAQNHAPA
jgi:hypothetical protein